MSKTRINLYDRSLLPLRQRLTLAALGRTVALVLLLGIGAMGLVYWQQLQLQGQLRMAEQRKQQLDSDKQLQEQALARHKADPALIHQVELEAAQLELKQRLLSELGLRTQLASQGFAPLLQELAEAADGSLWLDGILAEEGRYRFSGYTLKPAHVPQWVERLKQSNTLRGQSFAAMTMSRGEDKPLGFVLTSEPEEVKP
ncbi:PilN domain-containing protein [Shewanella cyperi]|uniref:PilN domain-containing protein n=1 Tax=Shewanella cyperi TaxID=2814292 RepID=UPI001A94B1CE|nr:PilN domain-containing protein [Shewanella cyperi]QSX40471.1 fimbrial assembly protein [Shewanella cyperi]